MSLDSKDSAILLELDRNCRQSLSGLASKLAIPIETLRYRIDRLVKSGIIKNFLAVIDGGRLGYYYFKVFLRLHNVNEKILTQIVANLVANPRICWVVRVDGSYDIGFTPRVTNPLEQSALMDAIRAQYAEVLHSWTLSVNVSMEFLSREYLTGNKKRQAVLGSYSAKKELYRMDLLEERVLQELAKDPRTSGAEIAKTLEVSTETVLSRIRKLEKNQVLVRYMAVINNELLGQINYYVLIYLNRLTADREKLFVSYCCSHSNIIYLIKSLGQWDYELNVEVRSVAEYRKLMMELTSKFSDIIREYNGLVVSEIAKYVYP